MIRGAIDRLKAPFRPIGSGFTRLDDDVMLVSYPRSGNTWARFLLGNLVAGAPVSFANIEKVVPDIYQNPDRAMRRLPRPRVLKSHEAHDPTYRRVIYLVRDPRDVAVSYHRYLIKVRDLDADVSIDSFVERFVTGSIDPYGAWDTHVRSWTTAAGGEQQVLRLRYEDVLVDAAEALRAMAAFVGISPRDEAISKAVAASSIAAMRDLEQQTGAGWRTLRGSRKDMTFLPHASVGTGLVELPLRSIAAIEEAWGATMLDQGYTLRPDR